MKKVLKLTLKKQPFEIMVTGEKKKEYREPSKWLLSRLYDKNGTPKHYDEIEFRNGYGKQRPYFITDFFGWYVNSITERNEYSNGLAVIVARGDYVICFEHILETGNI